MGDRWTYWLNYPHGPDSLITVVASHELGGQTYFEMSNDGGLYRVDDEKRTWKYDTASESEILFWDIWPDFIPYPEELQDKDKEAWAYENGYGFYTIIRPEQLIEEGAYIGPITARARCILAFVPLFWSVLSVFGTVEEFGTRELVQPDGTRITTRAYSDEFGYYLSTANGYVVKDSATGYYH